MGNWGFNHGKLRIYAFCLPKVAMTHPRTKRRFQWEHRTWENMNETKMLKWSDYILGKSSIIGGYN